MRESRVHLGLLILIVVCAANHGVHHLWPQFGWRRPSRPPANKGIVRTERTESGMEVAAIDESALARAGDHIVRFSVLRSWACDSASEEPPPAPIQALHGQIKTVLGFMSPLEPGEKVRRFLLSRRSSPGSRPKANRVILVEAAAPVSFKQDRPVAVRGRFWVAPAGSKGGIYLMEATSVTPIVPSRASPPEPRALPKRAVQFDFAWLEPLARLKPGQPLPQALLDHDGKTVTVLGRFASRDEGDPPVILVARRDCRGCEHHGPPDVSTAIPVRMKPKAHAPGVWIQEGTFTGKLRVSRDPTTWSVQPIVMIENAAYSDLRVEAESSAPLLPLWAEAVLAAGLALWMVRPFVARRRRRALLETGDMYAQEAAFVRLAESVRANAPVREVVKALGQPHARFQGTSPALGHADETWLYALVRRPDGPFLVPAQVAAPPADCASYEVGKCGMVLGIRDGRAVSRRLWARGMDRT